MIRKINEGHTTVELVMSFEQGAIVYSF